jgi:hypothetical protein
MIVDSSVSQETPAGFSVTIKLVVCIDTLLPVKFSGASFCKPLAWRVPVLIRPNIQFDGREIENSRARMEEDTYLLRSCLIF